MSVVSRSIFCTICYIQSVFFAVYYIQEHCMSYLLHPGTSPAMSIAFENIVCAVCYI